MRSVRVRQHSGMLGSLLLRDSASEDEAGLLARFGTGDRGRGDEDRKRKWKGESCTLHNTSIQEDLKSKTTKKKKKDRSQKEKTKQKVWHK